MNSEYEQAISEMSFAIAELVEAKIALADAQSKCEGTWGYFLSYENKRVEDAEKDLADKFASAVRMVAGAMMSRGEQ